MTKQLYIRTSSEYLEEWNKERIVSALIRETYLDRRTAEIISDEVEKQIIGLNIGILTSTLIRELVSAKLIELGLEKAHKMHTRLGVPLYDVEQIILHQTKDTAEFLPGPELTNLALASRIKREYALINVFSQDVADAHLRGDIYLEGLEFIDRLYAVGLSLEYLKKYGLNFSESGLRATPAKHPEALISQMVGFTEILRGHFFSSVEWDAVNILFAPYTEGLDNAELKQLAQKLTFELSRQSMSLRVATLLNLYWQIPPELLDTPALGSSRRHAAREACYRDYQTEARRIVCTMLELLSENDATGEVFTLPLPLLHLSAESLEAPDAAEYFDHIAAYILNKGHAVIVCDRQPQRRIFRSLTLPRRDLRVPENYWQLRHAIIHNVVINLPRLGYIARGSDLHLFAKLTEMLELTAEAHMQKRVFIEKLLAAGKAGPLGILMMKQDGKSFLQLEQADFLIGVVGLNELAQIHKGQQFHESAEAVAFGVEIMTHMESVCERLSQRHHISFVLTGFPNQAVASRVARLDLRYYSPDSGYVVKGDLGTGNVYYSDGICMNPAESSPLKQRIATEGRFVPYLRGGALSKVVVADQFTEKSTLIDFIISIFKETEHTQIYFAPHATTNVFNFVK